MGLQLNAAKARQADKFSSVIRETGKYIGIITRAEKLLSEKGTEGVGLSFKTDDGATANYLDVYTARADGSELWGANLIQSLLCCLKLKTVEEGPIEFERWDREVNEVVKATATGYPSLMGKRIGFVLQKELQTHHQTGADVERISLVRVFEPATGLTSSEILDGKTKAEKIDALMKALPLVRDSRKKGAGPKPAMAPAGGSAPAEFDEDIPF